MAWLSKPFLRFPRQGAANKSVRSVPTSCRVLCCPDLPANSCRPHLSQEQGWGSRLRAREAASLELKAQVTRCPSGPLTQMVTVLSAYLLPETFPSTIQVSGKELILEASGDSFSAWPAPSHLTNEDQQQLGLFTS